MATTIITGTTGILGRELVRELSQDSRNWKKVYALSRSKIDQYPNNVEHTSLDLTGSAEEMAKELVHIDADYIFFAAYLENKDPEERTRINGEMLENFLRAFEINGKATRIKRILLVCGLKQYGVHLGTPKQPMEETDPWLPEPPSNFYYRQQRSLHEFCAKHEIEWIVTYSNEVLGFAKGNFMNLASTIALYAAVHSELGTELPFPGAEANLWPKFARYFGLQVPRNQFSRPAPDPSDIPMAGRAPLDFFARDIGLEGRVKPNRLQQQQDLKRRSQKPEAQDAWKQLSDRYGLDEGAINKAT